MVWCSEELNHKAAVSRHTHTHTHTLTHSHTHTHTHLHTSTKHQKIYEAFLEAGTKKAAESESKTNTRRSEEVKDRRREDEDRSLNVEKKNIFTAGASPGASTDV